MNVFTRFFSVCIAFSVFLLTAEAQTLVFQQDFNSATEVTWTANTARSITTASGNNIVGNNIASQFTSITCNAKNNCGIGINSHEKNYDGMFGAFYDNTGGYWSIVKTTNFAASTPTALMVKMDVYYECKSSATAVGMNFAIGNGFTNGLTDNAPDNANVHSGFAIMNNNTLYLNTYNTTTRFTGNPAISAKTSITLTWVINNSGSAITYDNPAGGSTTLANDKFDIWEGTTLKASGISAVTASASLQNLYIGSNSGKKHEFRLDNLMIYDLTSCDTDPTVNWEAEPATTGCIVGGTGSATITTNYAAGVVWSSSDPSVLTVSGNGTTTATINYLSAGTATITATVTGDGSAICAGPAAVTSSAITVQACTPPAVTTQPENKTIQTGEATLLQCATNAAGATYQWYNATDNTAIGFGTKDAAVSVGTGYNAGGWTTPAFSTIGEYGFYCKITGSDGCVATTQTATVSVVAAPVPVTAIAINGASSVYEGATTTLTVSYTPADANQYKDITWSSADAGIATVSTAGVVTGVSAGTVIITATTANGKTATHEVTVVETPPAGVRFDANGGQVSPAQIRYTGSPIYFPTPTREGYHFAGWFTAASGGSQVASPYTPEEYVTLYAHWEATTLTLHVPGVYESEYQQTLKEEGGKKYEVYGIARPNNSAAWLFAGTQPTSTSQPQVMFNLVGFTSGTHEWMSFSTQGNGSSVTGTDEFSGMGSNPYSYKVYNNNQLAIRIKGYTEFALWGQDNNADPTKGKYLKIEINGEDRTTGLKTSLSIRRYALDANTEYIIRVTGVGGSNNYIAGFSLLPCQTSIEWVKEPAAYVEVGATFEAQVSVPDYTSIEWQADNTSLLSVAVSGTTAQLTYNAIGTVNLLVQAQNSCGAVEQVVKTIEITAPTPATSLTADDLVLEEGETAQLHWTFLPAEATDAVVSSFVSATPSIATVDSEGKVTGVAFGKTTVVLTSKSGLKAYASITVKPRTLACATWEGVPGAFTDESLSVDNLVISTLGVSISEQQVWKEGGSAHKEKVFNISSQDKYIQGSFTRGEEIETIEIGVATGNSSSNSFVIRFCGTSSFLEDYTTDLVLTAPSRDWDVSAVTHITLGSSQIPEGTRYFRIYRNYKNADGESIGGGTAVNVFYLQVCPVTPCDERVPRVAVTTGSPVDCEGATRVLTVSAYQEGATIQWYKDGVALAGETAATLTTTANGDYYAVATYVCDKQSNRVTLSTTADAQVSALVTEVTVKNDRPVQLDLFKVEGASEWTVTPAIAGCTYSLVDGMIRLEGTPTGLTNGNHTMTCNIKNTCTGATASASLTLHELDNTGKPTVAFIIEGSKGGGWTNTQDQGTALYDFLTTYYDVTKVNCYSTTDEAAIKAYYSQFDVVLMTDYPSTTDKDSKGKSYSNAIGCLIDVKPILTMETFVARLPNWKISSNPTNPSSDVQTLQVLCPAHAIFKYVTMNAQNEFQVINSGTLQGFEPIYAPDYQFIGTITSSGKTYVTCCERQLIIGARMIMLGLQYGSMGNITDNGKQAIHSIIDYLLETDPNNLSDCSMIFDNANGTGLWSDPANWAPAYTALPTPYHAARILYPCTVDIPNASASSIKLNKGNLNYNSSPITANGSLTINADAGLTVIGSIKEVRDNDFVTPYPVSPSDLVIHANSTSQGALAHGDEAGVTGATVDFYARGNGAPAADANWQYMGVPFSDITQAVDIFEYSWMCRWNEDSPGNAGSNWEWVVNEDLLIPFSGYALTQRNARRFTYSGTLAPSATQILYLTVRGNDYKGWNMFANSWMAPIKIAQFEDADFGSGIDKTIYLFNTGVNDGHSTASSSATSAAGQYIAVPINTASSMDASVQTIPPMQGFFLLTTAAASVTLNYDKLIYTTSFSQTTMPNRVPRRSTDPDEKTSMPRVVIDVNGTYFSDRLYLFENDTMTNGYDNGWDGKKLEGEDYTPQLMTRTGLLDLAVDVSPSFDKKQIAFRAGEDDEYTLRFSTTEPDLRLRDLLTGAEIDIAEGSEYHFYATNRQAEVRFEIGDYRQTVDVPTDLTEPQGFEAEVLALDVYGVDGKLLLHRTQDFSRPLQLPKAGVYILRLRTTQGIQVKKITF